MRIRTIKPEFFLHERLFEAEQQSGMPLRVAYAGLWCAADREGRFKWEPRRLGVQILPYDQVDFSRVLDALTTRGFIVKYASGTGEFGVIPSFTTHQVINNRERESELPNPAECLENTWIDACGTRDPREPDGNAESESGREGNKEQGTRKGKEQDVSATPLCPNRLEVGSWFGRRASTQWSAKELKAWKAIHPEDLAEGIAILKAPYEAKAKYTRKDLQTLLNNWTGEIDRWRNWQAPAASDVTNRQHDELPAFLEDDNAIFKPKAA